MDVFSIILIVFGLILFEAVSSIDNAVINDQVFSTMSEKARRWSLIWWLLIAVFLLRGLLPFGIVFMTNPSLGVFGTITAAFSSNPKVHEAVELSAPTLLIGGGIFLIFLFLHWLFLEPKKFGLRGERFIQSQGVWFYAIISITLAAIVWFALKINPLMAFGAVVGSTAFFITHGFKENAEKAERSLLTGPLRREASSKTRSDLSKILYLEVIDATFSIDGVVGAFAFTLSVPLILLGNGIGAFVVREVTIHNIERIQRYVYLKNGAMYSILFLGVIMILNSFGF
ncbi:MAG: DUF475 domain-containing protein, partial [Candidatus Daviesbacteria bacterium]|nr:DUF475 domain-containing protein [Candidatus Daviesbacteria bacterium]